MVGRHCHCYFSKKLFGVETLWLIMSFIPNYCISSCVAIWVRYGVIWIYVLWDEHILIMLSTNYHYFINIQYQTSHRIWLFIYRKQIKQIQIILLLCLLLLCLFSRRLVQIQFNVLATRFYEVCLVTLVDTKQRNTRTSEASEGWIFNLVDPKRTQPERAKRVRSA